MTVFSIIFEDEESIRLNMEIKSDMIKSFLLRDVLKSAILGRTTIFLLLSAMLFMPSAASAKTKGIGAPETAGSVTGSRDSLKTGDLYALVVGVSKYKDPKISGLEFADKDAKSFGEFLQSQHDIFRETKVTFFLNEQATKADLEKYLYYTLPKAGKDDTVILFFSGHGTFDPIRPSDFLFVAYDSEPEFIGTTGVKMSGLDFLKSVNAEKLLIIADACYAGGFSDLKSKNTPSLEMFLQEARNSSGRAIMTSAKDQQLSWESPNLKGSVFTHNLLEGLKGKADKDRDGIVTLHEAYNYAYAKTKEATGGRQHPQLEEKIVGPFPLSFTAPKVPASELKKQLFKAVEFGRLPEVEQLVSHVDVNSRDHQNDTPLIIAARAGRSELMQFLLDKGADTEATNHFKATALISAAENGQKTSVEALLKAGATADVKDAEGRTPLALAAANGHLRIAELLLDHGADVKSRTNKGDTALTLASGGGYEEIVQKLLNRESGAKPEDLDAPAALMSAARAGKINIVNMLMAKGVAPEMKNADNCRRKIVSAVLKGNLKELETACDSNERPDFLTDSGDSPLTLASGLGNTDVVRFLLNKGATANFRSYDDVTPLMAAAANGHLQVVKLLMERGAQINATDKHGNTAVLLSVEKVKPQVLKILIAAGADLEALDNKGVSALIHAVRTGNSEIVKQLLRAKADVNACDFEGKTALMYAAISGDQEIAQTLLAGKADVNIKDRQRSSALIYAAKNGRRSVVKLLLANGADRKVEDWEGKTALMLASERDLPDIVELLKPR